MDLTKERKRIKSAISRCATLKAKGQGFNWDNLGMLVNRLSQNAFDEVNKENLSYSHQCKLETEIHNDLEGLMNSFFQLDHNAYDWVNGNNKFKQLVLEKKQAILKKQSSL